MAMRIGPVTGAFGALGVFKSRDVRIAAAVFLLTELFSLLINPVLTPHANTLLRHWGSK